MEHSRHEVSLFFCPFVLLLASLPPLSDRLSLIFFRDPYVRRLSCSYSDVEDAVIFFTVSVGIPFPKEW